MSTFTNEDTVFKIRTCMVSDDFTFPLGASDAAPASIESPADQVVANPVPAPAPTGDDDTEAPSPPDDRGRGRGGL